MRRRWNIDRVGYWTNRRLVTGTFFLFISAKGGVAIFSSILFLILVSDTPSTHRCISGKEKLYIEKSIGKQEVCVHKVSKKILSHLKKKTCQIWISHQRYVQMTKPNSIPWKSILTTKCTLALFVCHVADAWFQHTLPTILPTYLSNVLHFNITEVSRFAKWRLPGFTRYVCIVHVIVSTN